MNPALMQSVYSNGNVNPFSMVFDKFLDTQVYLEASHTVVINLETKLSMDFMHPYQDANGKLLGHAKVYRITPSNPIILNDLRGYLYLLLLAQSVENFEAFLKKCIVTINSHQSKTAGLLLPINTRSNKERVKQLKDFCPNINQQLQTKRYSEMYNAFIVVEKVRKLTIHENQTLNSENQDLLNVYLFLKRFKTKVVDGKHKISISVGESQQLIIILSNLAFMIFESLSKFLNCPILLGNFQPKSLEKA